MRTFLSLRSHLHTAPARLLTLIALGLTVRRHAHRRLLDLLPDIFLLTRVV